MLCNQSPIAIGGGSAVTYLYAITIKRNGIPHTRDHHLIPVALHPIKVRGGFMIRRRPKTRIKTKPAIAPSNTKFKLVLRLIGNDRLIITPETSSGGVVQPEGEGKVACSGGEPI